MQHLQLSFKRVIEQSGYFPRGNMSLSANLTALSKSPSSSKTRSMIQKLGNSFLLLTALTTVIPIFAIVIYILIQGLPAISWSFLTTFPYDGVKRGGFFQPFLGLFYLPLVPQYFPYHWGLELQFTYPSMRQIIVGRGLFGLRSSTWLGYLQLFMGFLVWECL